MDSWWKPFDENDPKDIEKLNLWKSKNTRYLYNAINVWTIRDPMKVKLAKESNLNIEFIY